MNYYVVCFDFQIQKSNVKFSGRFGDYHYHIEQDKLSVIYTKKKNRTPDISYHFKLDADFYGLISLLSLAFDIRFSTSRLGYSFKNSSSFDKLLKNRIEYSELHKKLHSLTSLSRLQADHLPVGFDSSSTEHFGEKHLQLAKAITVDLTKIIRSTSQKNTLLTQLDYWRRGFDLSELHFNTEGFLNYFKIIEHILKDHPDRKLTDTYIMNELKKLHLTRLTRKVCLYRNLRNKFNIGHYIPSAPTRNDYTEYLSNMSDWIWNHDSDLSQVAKLLILRNAGYKEYYLEEDGGLFFLNRRS